MLQVAKSTRGASAVVTCKQVLEEEQLVVLPSYIHACPYGQCNGQVLLEGIKSNSLLCLMQ